MSEKPRRLLGKDFIKAVCAAMEIPIDNVVSMSIDAPLDGMTKITIDFIGDDRLYNMIEAMRAKRDE